MDIGGGMIALDPGLGKTMTGLAIAQKSVETGKAKRICYVVPKSVLGNWAHEADIFFGEDNLVKDKAFIGLKFSNKKDGSLAREKVTNELGEPLVDANNQPIMRPIVEIDTSASTVVPQLHKVLNSNVKMVFMTRDVFAALELRTETMQHYVNKMTKRQILSESSKYKEVAENYTDEKNNMSIRNAFANKGSTKKSNYPYFEDLMFDSIIADEAHHYRNSAKTGKIANSLAYISNSAIADRAVDMQIKCDYVKDRNKGKGVFQLTATPVVNSIIDGYNLLSQVVPQDVMDQMGFYNSDDFLRHFGEIGIVDVHKLNGEMETKEGLIGFKNLEAYRNLFNRFATFKTAADIESEVHIPDFKRETLVISPSKEQKQIYDELRARADNLHKGKADGDAEESDTVFGLMRKMDKANTDLDLYHGHVTYRFDKKDRKKVDELLANIDRKDTVTQRILDEKTGNM